VTYRAGITTEVRDRGGWKGVGSGRYGIMIMDGSLDLVENINGVSKIEFELQRINRNAGELWFDKN
jgi:hypothetical protein